MGRIILVIGEPGTGKSRGILNLDENTTLLIKPNRKELPFRGGAVKYSVELGNVVNCTTFPEMKTILTKANEGTKFKTIVIEDLTHFFTARVMADAKINGFGKWTDLAVDVFQGLIKIEEKLRSDLDVIVIGHTERGTDVNGNSIITLQTPGKLLDNQIKIPSYITYVLHTDVKEVNGKMEYSLLTNSDGIKLAKSPEDCLTKFEPNDYSLILNKIHKYQLGE
jgi:hypothetical protein